MSRDGRRRDHDRHHCHRPPSLSPTATTVTDRHHYHRPPSSCAVTTTIARYSRGVGAALCARFLARSLRNCASGVFLGIHIRTSVCLPTLTVWMSLISLLLALATRASPFRTISAACCTGPC